MRSRFTMVWDIGKLAEAFGVAEEDVVEYLTDGRRVSFMIERRLVADNPGWSLAPSEGAGYDLKDPDGGLWEVRSITRGGVYFNPSSQVGSGRKFMEAGFLAKLNAVKGFILADIVNLPIVSVFKIPAEVVGRWYKEGMLGASTKVSRAVFHARLLPQLPVDI